MLPRLFSLLSLLLICITKAAASGCQTQCVSAGEWQIGLATGYGELSNPLRGGSEQPVVLIGDIAWYGEQFYIDNLEAGYEFIQHDDLFSQGFVTVNREARYFDDWRFFDVQNSLSPLGSGNDSTNVKQLADRQYAVHAGMRSTLLTGFGQISAMAQTDISQTHSGQLASIRVQFLHNVYQWQLNSALSLTWYSSEFNNYYYGISDRDAVSESEHYSVGAGWRPGIELTAVRALNSNWGLLLLMRYEHLPAGVRHSPVVTDNSLTSVFGGLTYQF